MHSDGRRLLPCVGRDRDGNDIDEPTAYNSTLVDRVRDTGEALIVTGSEEAVALGSRSAHVHGLRSIMIAPLRTGRRLFGVIYLDTRVAKGMFTTDDVGVLTAITQHVASSLHDARPTRSPRKLSTARAQPHHLLDPPDSTSTAASTDLTPDAVTTQLLRCLAQTPAGDTAVLLSRDGDQFVVLASQGEAAPVGTRLDTAQSAALLDLTGPRTGTISPGTAPPFGDLLGSPRTWWAMPVAEPGKPPRVLVIGSNQTDVMHRGHVDLAAALARDAAQHDGVRPCDSPTRYGPIDGLTGLPRHSRFLAQAGEQLGIAQNYRRAVAAIVLDVNHLKRITDSYGHTVADEVIRSVATRLRTAARDGDVLGRVGAEEFAFLTSDTAGDVEVLAARLRDVVCGQPVSTEAGALRVTVTIGMASADSSQPDLEGLLAKAGAMLRKTRHESAMPVKETRLDG
jgi:diguanylate cyclase (GGDEF)-like protein